MIMEYKRNTSKRSGCKDWRFGVSVTMLLMCICVYATWNGCDNPETLSETQSVLTDKADCIWFKFKSNTPDGHKILQGSKRNKIMGGARRVLGGPGSWPPRCNSKCGRCTPCKPVHVPVPPGTPVTTEYYPEAWRCKCGNKLYMP